jgi:hypothetical protein
MLDILIGKVQGDHGCRGTLFEKCNLGLKYLSPKNGLSTDPDFETGVAEIQSGSEQTMMQAEKRARRAFQKDANLESDDESDLTVDSGGDDFFLREFEKAKKQRQKNPAARVTILTVILSLGVQLLLKVFGECMMHLIPRGAVVCLQSRLK